MTRSSLLFGFALAASSIGSVFGQPARAADAINAPSCLDWSKAAPYRGYGYNHVVSLTNGCEHALSCRVSTSATPTAVRVDLDPNDQRAVTTRVGSPARAFDVRLTCEQ